MKIQQLLKNIKKEDFSLEKALKVKEYMPVMEKRAFVMDVIAACTDEIDSLITVDRFRMGVYFDMNMLKAYTNLEISSEFSEMIDQYDSLCKSGVLNQILKMFETDYNAMNAILKAEIEELLIQNSIEAQIVKISNKISSVLDTLGTTGLGNVLNQIGDNKDFAKMLEMLK